LLAVRHNAEHVRTMRMHHILGSISSFVNLYPFEATVARSASFDDCIGTIDIGVREIGPLPRITATCRHCGKPEDYAVLIPSCPSIGE